MTQFNIQEAKTLLPRLVDRAWQGEEIVIAKRGRPVARLVPFEREPRRPGLLKGKVTFGSEFDDPLPAEIAAAFRGERP